MKYKNIITYKKIIKNIKISFKIVIFLIMFSVISLLLKSIAPLIIGLIVGIITLVPEYIKLEQEIKEMEINAQYDKTEQDPKIKLKDGKIDLDNWD